MSSNNLNRKLKLRITFDTGKEPYLLDISSFLYDLELLHDYLVMVLDEDYSRYKFSQYFYYRKGRRLKEIQRLRLAKITKASPLTIELILNITIPPISVDVAFVSASAGAAYLLSLAVQKWIMLPHNKEKARAEAAKFRAAARITDLQADLLEEDVEEKRRLREMIPVHDSLRRRLSDSPLKATNMELSIEDEDEPSGHTNT
ncbi:MAG: hypothetical protein Q7T26_07840 [Dehalococcoidia bacterium]|nr:hypothetical protein [Dehalococcoidia bacterium]